MILFLGHGGYLLGGKLDVVHEGLLCLVAADVHHLEDGVPVTEVHIRDAGASGGVARHAVIAWHNHIAVKVGFFVKTKRQAGYRFLLLFSQRLLLLHCELGRCLLFQ